MAMGIGQQIKGMMDRARHYWAELTDEKDSRHRTQQEREESVHQRYGGVRGQEESDSGSDLRGRTEGAAGRIPPEASPGSRSARGGQSTQMGGPSDRDQQMQGAGQAQRQYTQQGGSGIQKTLGEQSGGSESDTDASRSPQGRRPGQQNH